MISKRSIRIAGHETSITLEDEFWKELQNLADRKKVSLAQLVTDIDGKRYDSNNLSSALRVYVLKNLQLQLSMK